MKPIIRTSLWSGRLGQWSNGLGVGLRNGLFRLQLEQARLRMLDQYFGYDVMQVTV